MGQVFSDLDYDGDAPVRARPEVGEWGPREVVSTAHRKRLRVWVTLAFLAAVVLIVAVGAFWFHLVQSA